jgi:hypothetical protein
MIWVVSAAAADTLVHEDLLLLGRKVMEEALIRSTSRHLKLDQEQAVQAVHMLVSEGRVAARDVHAVLKRREKLIRELCQRLSALGDDGFKAHFGCEEQGDDGAGQAPGGGQRLPKQARVKIQGDSGEERSQGGDCGEGEWSS